MKRRRASEPSKPEATDDRARRTNPNRSATTTTPRSADLHFVHNMRTPKVPSAQRLPGYVLSKLGDGSGRPSLKMHATDTLLALGSTVRPAACGRRPLAAILCPLPTRLVKAAMSADLEKAKQMAKQGVRRATTPKTVRQSPFMVST